jgi:hypothetical protein
MATQSRIGWRPYVNLTAQQLQTATYLLDSYSGTAVAYSLRKLRSSYSGSAIRVRRSSDNVEQNIGFDANGNLDTTSLSSFTNPTDTGKLLDSYSGASVAYSLRKLSATYSGSAIRVRRSGDNSEQNIGFDAGGNLDTTGLLSFVGSGSGFVTTWYDQSGNGNHAFQTSASVQPQIVSNGSLILRNSKPYIEATSSRYFQFTNELYNAAGSEYSLWMTYVKDTGGNQAILLTNGNSYMWLDYGIQQSFSPNTATNISAHATNTLYLINNMAGNSGSTQYRNSLSIGSSGAPGVARATHLPSASFRTAKITMSEFIYYPTNKTSQRVGISANINGYYSIHTPNGSAFVTTWYDQSGNGRNATQTTASSQPMILSSGSINLVGGKPSIYFNGANFISSPYNVGTTNEMYFLTQTTDTVYLYPSNNTLVNYGFVAQSGQFNGLNSNYGLPQLYTNGFLRSLTNRNDIYNFLNGYKLSVHKGANLTGWSANPTMFGNYYGSGYEYTGDLQEWLIYPTLQGSQSQIESNINSHYSLWDSSIVQSGLVMNLDAGFKSSYPATGSTWYDISGYGNNNGTLTNGVGYSSVNGGVMTFDGVNDYVDCGNSSTFNQTNALTLSTWVKINSFASTNTIIGKQWCYGNQYSYSLAIDTQGKLQFYYSLDGGYCGGTFTSYISSNSISTNTWYNIVLSFTNTSVKLYLNGQLISGIQTGINTSLYVSNSPVLLGIYRNLSGTYGDALNGSMGSTLIYNRALSATEVLQNFNVTKSRFGL